MLLLHAFLAASQMPCEHAVDLREGVYYQKCYDPECRSYRSACMPLPSQVWLKYRQHAVQEAQGADAAAAAGQPAGKLAAAAEAVQGAGMQQRHQQGQYGHAAEVRFETVEEEDEQCLQLLQQFEDGTAAARGGAAAKAAYRGAVQPGSCPLQQQQVAAAAGAEAADEYMQCLRLLQEVEGGAAWAADTG
jgi:hypothetical protein